MYTENTNENIPEQKPFEPTSIELRKQYNTLDGIIRTRSTQLKEEQSTTQPENNSNEEDNGFLPPYNSAF